VLVSMIESNGWCGVSPSSFLFIFRIPPLCNFDCQMCPSFLTTELIKRCIQFDLDFDFISYQDGWIWRMVCYTMPKRKGNGTASMSSLVILTTTKWKWKKNPCHQRGGLVCQEISDHARFCNFAVWKHVNFGENIRV